MTEPQPSAGRLSPAPVVVLDTNVVLDCWLFEAPAALALRRAIEQRWLRWVVSAPMVGELQAVLARPMGLRWDGRRERLLTLCPSRYGEPVPAAPCLPSVPQCTDPDDQKFVDLALHRGASWLVTRDNALLRLRRRAAAQGLVIIPPEHGPWRNERPRGPATTGDHRALPR